MASQIFEIETMTSAGEIAGSLPGMKPEDEMPLKVSPKRKFP